MPKTHSVVSTIAVVGAAVAERGVLPKPGRVCQQEVPFAAPEPEAATARVTGGASAQTSVALARSWILRAHAHVRLLRAGAVTGSRLHSPRRAA
jgi:hypothetical protein